MDKLPIYLAQKVLFTCTEEVTPLGRCGPGERGYNHWKLRNLKHQVILGRHQIYKLGMGLKKFLPVLKKLHPWVGVVPGSGGITIGSSDTRNIRLSCADISFIN